MKYAHLLYQALFAITQSCHAEPPFFAAKHLNGGRAMRFFTAAKNAAVQNDTGRGR